MKKYLFIIVIIGGLALACQVVSAADSFANNYITSGDFLIKNVTVIDGLGNKQKNQQDIFISDGKITAITLSGKQTPSSSTQVIDGKGLTAIPGLIDAHIHIKTQWHGGVVLQDKYPQDRSRKKLQKTFAAFLYSGVTTVFSVGDPTDFAVDIREKLKNGYFIGPRLHITGMPFSQHPSGWDGAVRAETVGDPHPSELSVKIDSNDPEVLGKKLDEYVEKDIKIIKIYSGASALGTTFLLREAKKRNIRAVADLWQMNMDRPWMQMTGLDGWAHATPFDAGDGDLKWMAENDRFVIVTANVGEKLSGLRVKEDKNKSLYRNPLVVDIWGKDVVKDFYESYPKVREIMYDGPDSFYQQNNFGDLSGYRTAFLDNIKKAYDAGVLLVGGTDAPAYPSLWSGETMHRELELLVMAGISPIDAIKICSYNGAKILEEDNQYGSIQVGLEADIILVSGKPWKNISDTRNIKYLFLKGNLVDREKLLTSWK